MPPRRQRANPSGRPEGVSENHWAKYLANIEKYSQRKVLSGRAVDLNGLEGYHFPSQYQDIGWESLLTLNGKVRLDNVREFYAGFEFIRGNTPYVHFILGGKYHRYSLATLGDILDLTSDGPRVWFEGKDYSVLDEYVSREVLYDTLVDPSQDLSNIVLIYTKHLHTVSRFHDLVIQANVLPKAGEREMVRPFKAYLMYCVSMGVKVDLLYIVLNKMATFDTQRALLPYGLLLNRLFNHIRCISVLTENPQSAITKTSVSFIHPQGPEVARRTKRRHDGASSSRARLPMDIEEDHEEEEEEEEEEGDMDEESDIHWREHMNNDIVELGMKVDTLQETVEGYGSRLSNYNDNVVDLQANFHTYQQQQRAYQDWQMQSMNEMMALMGITPPPPPPHMD